MLLLSLSAFLLTLFFCKIPLFLLMQEQSSTPPHNACQRVAVRREPLILNVYILLFSFLFFTALVELSV